MPWARCRASMSSSWNEPSSRRYSIRSRAVIFPLACWRSTAWGDPACRASSLRALSSASRCDMGWSMGREATGGPSPSDMSRRRRRPGPGPRRRAVVWPAADDDHPARRGARPGWSGDPDGESARAGSPRSGRVRPAPGHSRRAAGTHVATAAATDVDADAVTATTTRPVRARRRARPTRAAPAGRVPPTRAPAPAPA